MRKTVGLNKYQKAAHRPGEVQVSRAEVDELITLSCSADVEDRLTAAKYLCPCHVQGRVNEAWDALYRMMEDIDPRVRQQAWHALEDGGLPSDPAQFAQLERLYQKEPDAKVRRFAWTLIGEKSMAQKAESEMRLKLSNKPKYTTLGKCDFCGQSATRVRQDFSTALSMSHNARMAWICENCETVAA